VLTENLEVGVWCLPVHGSQYGHLKAGIWCIPVYSFQYSHVQMIMNCDCHYLLFVKCVWWSLLGTWLVRMKFCFDSPYVAFPDNHGEISNLNINGK